MDSRFLIRLAEWQAAAQMTQRQLASVIGVHETLLTHLRSGARKVTPEFMTRAIARAPEPWKSALKQARQDDMEASDALAVVA